MPQAAAYVTGTVLRNSAAHARQIEAMCRAFSERLNGQFLLIRPQEGDPLSPLIPVHHVRSARGPRPWRQALAAAATARLLARQGDPLVFVREFPVAALLWASGYRVVLELHQMPGPAIQGMLRFLSARGRFAVLSISAALEKDLRAACPAARDLRSYHDGAFAEDYKELSREEYAAIRRELGLGDGVLLAAYTGSIYKGRDAQSIRRLAAAFPHVQFLLAGGQGALLEALRDFYAGFPNVKCLGQRDAAEVRRLQSVSDILLYPLTRSNPLWRHTSPLKLFEYMAAGRTIVASNIGSAGEIADDSNAYVFDGDDEEAMIAAFARALAASDEEREEKQQRCKALIRERYDWRRRADFILSCWPPGGGAA